MVRPRIGGQGITIVLWSLHILAFHWSLIVIAYFSNARITWFHSWHYHAVSNNLGRPNTVSTFLRYYSGGIFRFLRERKLLLGDPPCNCSNLIIARSPLFSASNRGVQPWLPLDVGSAPCSRSSLMAVWLPFSTARSRGVTSSRCSPEIIPFWISE